MSQRVIVEKGNDARANVRRALQGLGLPRMDGRRVLVKPNAGRMSRPGSGVVTHPEVVAEAVRFFADLGGRVTVGESPILGVDALGAMQACGIAAAAREAGAELVDMDHAAPEVVHVGGMLVDAVKVCRAARRAHVIVSVPVMKTHMHTVVSLSIKNMKGVLYRREKVRMHQFGNPGSGAMPRAGRPLDEAIAELATVLMPDVALIDGTVGMEGMGPSAGRARAFGVIVASTDAVAADAVAARLMGVDPAEVPHLALAAERTGRSIDLDSFDVTPRDYRKWEEPFRPPPKEVSIDYPDVQVHESQACSACLSTVLMFLERYNHLMDAYRLADGKLHIAIGKGVSDVPGGTIIVGNCAVDVCEGGCTVRGCPPVGSDILKAMKARRGPAE